MNFQHNKILEASLCDQDLKLKSHMLGDTDERQSAFQ